MGADAKRRLRVAFTYSLRALAALVLIGSASSLTDSNQWWIRIWDFPRSQLLMVMLVLAVLLFVFDRAWRPWFSVVLVLAACWQLYRIHPYTWLAKPEVASATSAEAEKPGCFKVLTFNVYQANRDYARTLELLEREDADVLVLLETDAPWHDALVPLLSRYPHVLKRPLDNTYGLIFASRLPTEGATILDLAQKDTPSAHATLTAGGRDFRLFGLHPRPPHPGQDTEERDAELVVVARRAAKAKMPVLAVGDFNDVAWSRTSQLFKSIGAFLDPRIGRGTYATFPADMVWLGWPLDHLYMTEEFLLRDLRVLPNVGSDHRAVAATLCLAPATGERRNDEPEAVTDEDEAEADEAIDKYREDATKDAVEGEGER